MPEGYRGVVVRECEDGKNTGAESQWSEGRGGMDGVLGEVEEEEEEAVQVLEEVAGFDEVVVWGHELVPEVDDNFVKGVAEWIRFAEAVSYSILGASGGILDRRC